MSNKEKILAVIRSLPDEASIDEATERLYLLWRLERGLEQADNGDDPDPPRLWLDLVEDTVLPDTELPGGPWVVP